MPFLTSIPATSIATIDAASTCMGSRRLFAVSPGSSLVSVQTQPRDAICITLWPARFCTYSFISAASNSRCPINRAKRYERSCEKAIDVTGRYYQLDFGRPRRSFDSKLLLFGNGNQKRHFQIFSGWLTATLSVASRRLTMLKRRTRAARCMADTVSRLSSMKLTSVVLSSSEGAYLRPRRTKLHQT